MQAVPLRSWLIWFIAGLFYLFEFIHRVVVSVMIPELSKSFAVGSALLSSLSAAYFFAYALAQIPVGMLIDRYGTRILLSLACLAITVSSFAFAYSESLLLANLCRLMIGLGSAFAFVGCLKLAATWFPAYKFAFIVGLTNLLGVFGAIIGGGPAAHAVDEFGWRNVMYSSGFVGLILTFMLWHIVRDSTKKTAPNKAIKNLAAVFKDKQNWLTAIFAGCMVAPIVTYTELWGVTFLVKMYNMERPFAAHITTLTFIGIALGGPIIGWLSDYCQQRTKFMAAGMIGAFICISIILFAAIKSIWLIYILHFMFGFFTSSMLLCFTLNSEDSPPKIRATTIAFTNCIIMLAGAGLQMMSGYLLDYTYYNFSTSFIPLISCYMVATLCLTYIKEPPCRFREE